MMRRETLSIRMIRNGFLFPVLFTALIPLLTECSRNPEKIIARLEEKVREIPAEGTDRQEAVDDLIEEIEAYQKKENESRIQTIADNAAEGIFEESGDGRVFLFRVGSKKWTALHPGGTTTFSGGDRPKSLLVSYRGRYAIFAVPDEERCRFGWIDLGENFSSPGVHEDLFESSCDQPIAPGDDGSIYFERGGDIFQRTTVDGKERMVLAKGFFHPQFPKVANGFHLIPVPDGLWILYGSAGYYDLYHYAGVPGVGRKVAQGIASPIFQIAADGLFAAAHAEGKPVEPPSEQSDLLFLYTGEAGRYRLQGFRLPGNSWKSFQIPVRRNIYYLKQEGQFLYVKDSFPVRINPANGKESRLPIRARRVFVHANGLIYIDEKQHLLLRTEPYSEFEKKLFQIKEGLEQNYR